MAATVFNYASGIGINDTLLLNNPSLEPDPYIGSGDLSLNAAQQQYMLSQLSFTTPPAISGNGISFSGWFYPVGNQSLGSTIFDISGNGVSCVLYYYNTSNKLAGYFNGVSVNSSITITPGSWHYFCYTICCTSSGSALQSLYIDNSYNSTGSYPATSTTASYTSFSVAPTTSNTTSYLGYGIASGSLPTLTYFNGKIDDFRFYNRVLSQPEVNVLYSFNVKSGATPSVTAQISYDLSYVNAVQIDVSGTFSGLYVTRMDQATNGTISTNTTAVSCANLVYVNSTTWAYVDTTVIADSSYSYSITPYVMNTTGTMVNLNNTFTTPIINGFLNKGTGLPASGAAVTVSSTIVPGWSFTSTSGITLCNGNVTGVYGGILPSSVTYYLNILQTTTSTVKFQQYVGIYQNTYGFVSFYAWPKDGTYTSNQTLSVFLDCQVLLNKYSFSSTSATGTPYTSFNLPFKMTNAGMVLLAFTITNSLSTTTGINIGGIQIRSQATDGIGYKCIDPSGLVLYYPFDKNTISANMVTNCAAGFPGVLDASLNSGAMIASTTAPLMGDTDVCFNGTSSYVAIGSWNIPPRITGKGFSISGWFFPSSSTPVNSLLYWFNNPNTSVNMMAYLTAGAAIDFSYNLTQNISGGVELVTSTNAGFSYLPNAWNFFAMTGLCGTDLSGSFTYYVNDVSVSTLVGAWPNTSTTASQLYNRNCLGGFPTGTSMNVNSDGSLGYLLGCMDDFRVYNRCLSSQDVLTLWSYGFANSCSFMNVLDPTALSVYYPMDHGMLLKKSPPSAFGTFTLSSIITTGFVMSFTGGVGFSVSYTFTVNGTSYTPTGSPATGFTFSGLANAGAASFSPTPYAWTVVVTATNSGGSYVSNPQVVFIPPTITGNFSNGVVLLSLTSGYSGGIWSYSCTSGSIVPYGIVTGYTSFATMASDVSKSTFNGLLWTLSLTQVASPLQTNTINTIVCAYPMLVNSIVNYNSTDLSGVSTTNAINYNVYCFMKTGTNYTINYTCYKASYIYVLAVGGGGGGAGNGGGGGGAGGVVMMPVYLPVGQSTININVGAGGAAASDGVSTTVSFTAIPSVNIVAMKGAGAASSGGVGRSYASSAGNGISGGTYFNMNSNAYNNFGSPGGIVNNAGAGGGGGAGTPGAINSMYSQVAGNGGNGIQCFLPGIRDFKLNNNPFGKYYWGGGGGAGSSSQSRVVPNNGNGGLGGGGGGASASSYNAGLGGASSLNSGTPGAINNGAGGNGGANTGSGGGGAWNGSGGAGGSGIVIIAFPQLQIATNKQAVAPNAANDMISMSPLSATAISNFKGAFACQLLNYNYFGPVMTLRASFDAYGNYTANFYADVNGNLGTGYLGTGTPLVSWLKTMNSNTTYAYVTKWFNQGMDVCFNSAYQYKVGSQPIYDAVYGIINFGYQGTNGGVSAPQTNTYLQLSDGALPYTDSSFTYTFRYWNAPTNSAYNGQSVISGGSNAGTGTGLTLDINAGGQYLLDLYAAGYALGSYLTSAVLTWRYTSQLWNLNINGGSVLTATTISRVQTPVNNVIGTCNTGQATNSYNPFNGQLYYMYIFSTSIADTDRIILESTPSYYPYNISNTQLSVVTYSSPVSVLLSWTANSNVNYYSIYLNNYYFGTMTNASTANSLSLPSLSILDSSYQITLVGFNTSNVIQNVIVSYKASQYTYLYSNTDGNINSWLMGGGNNPVAMTQFLSENSNLSTGANGCWKLIYGGAYNVSNIGLTSFLNTTISFDTRNYGTNYPFIQFLFGGSDYSTANSYNVGGGTILVLDSGNADWDYSMLAPNFYQGNGGYLWARPNPYMFNTPIFLVNNPSMDTLWYHIDLSIDAVGNGSVYVNGALKVQVNISSWLNGTWMFLMGRGGGQMLVDNFTIKNAAYGIL